MFIAILLIFNKIEVLIATTSATAGVALATLAAVLPNEIGERAKDFEVRCVVVKRAFATCREQTGIE